MPQLEWDDACQRVQAEDNQPVRDVGAWSEDKLFVWHKYIQMTTWAMGAHSKWRAGLAYVDLFAGPGVCRIEQSGRRVPGSPLIAAYAQKPFEKILLVESKKSLAIACQARLEATGVADRSRVFQGDCNELIQSVVDHIPRKALTLAFIDPEGLARIIHDD